MSDFASALPVRSTDLDIRDLLFATDKADVSGSAVTADVTATDLDIRNLTFATDKVDASGSTGLVATVTASNLDIRDLAFATDKVDVSGSLIAADWTDAPAEGPVHDYATSAAVGAGASVNHDYTVTAAKTLLLKQILASASGKIKVEVKANAITKFVMFNSTAEPSASTELAQALEVAATLVVRVTITNLEASAMDVYSTIIGNEITA